MLELEHQLTRARGILRRAWARTANTDPELVAPARLVLRLDDTDIPGSLGAGELLTIHQWNQVIAQAVEQFGPLPVTVLAQHNTADERIAPLIRFAHRLECHTLLVTDGTGIDDAYAELLVDVGLASIRVLIGGVSDGIQAATVGNTAAEATGAVASLLSARTSRNSTMDIEVAIPWTGPVVMEISAIVGWARQAGVDGVRILAPLLATDLPADPELLDKTIDSSGVFCRNSSVSVDEIHAMVAHQDGKPGLARNNAARRRKKSKCPVGGQRLVIGAAGNVYSCPFHPPIGELSEELRDTLALGRAHLEAIASCNRVCSHVELAPAPIFG
ncbi:MAG: hypothetical protein ACPGTU_17370 [Myxococcota bacterium]